MRGLIILSAILAFTSGAPSSLILAPLTPPIAIVPNPTISPGDLQAAAINAKVNEEDAIQAAKDQAREFTEQAIENQNDKVVEVNDQVKEQTIEAFWTGEDRKWQALDAVKTAEAQLDGAIANNANTIAKSAISTPLIAAIPVLSPPIVNINLAEPVIKTTAAETGPITAKIAEKTVPLAEAAKVGIAPVEKSIVTQSLAQTHPGVFIAPVGLAPFKIADPWLDPSLAAYVQPQLKPLASPSLSQQLAFNQGFFANEAFLKTVW